MEPQQKSSTQTKVDQAAAAADQSQAQALQNRLYLIVENLQMMAQEIPTKYQQRISIELLSGLANTLLHGVIFEIVKGLKEIQDVTEKQLYQQRLQIIETHRVDRQLVREKRKSTAECDAKLKVIYQKQKDELKKHDLKVLLQMDQKISDQQQLLEKAGVPGFYVTNEPSEIQVQMYLLSFIMKLSEMELPDVTLS